ncbi:Thg1 C terminal domain-containing protein [Massariosphaeria phaeospora]|uniref:tRNA(His) guanylyltransferase n=1 Tax=Massariosphaeria phaeospora TaxID=100035 RepID=A0A7C8HYK8_9PLEO|nr:Thg1 C terminal domain-containing protein [Massariosphaeria phaeospora]
MAWPGQGLKFEPTTSQPEPSTLAPFDYRPTDRQFPLASARPRLFHGTGFQRRTRAGQGPMANSKYEYVRAFELPDVLLANTWIVVRIDGRGFSKLTAKYKFTKPNDKRALDLMNAAAEAVMKELPDLVLAYGNSDEFSKLTTTIASTFTSYYTHLWRTYFPDTPLTPPLPSFDGRAVCYPSDQNLRDYMSWRQVDCHINNLYNTTFWTLVQQGGIDARTAEQELSGTVSSDKNEILFSRFGVNYNNEPEIFRKGSVLYRDFFPISTPAVPTLTQTTISTLECPRPRRRSTLTRPMSQPLERTLPVLLKDSLPSSAASTPRGPTFLSTSRTPSPPSTPSSMSIPAFPYPLRSNHHDNFPQTFMPVPPPSNGSASTTGKKPLPMLTPIPLAPPTLKPSTKPPASLNPPNPTTHANTSPLASPDTHFPIPARTSSSPSKHSASASLPPSTSASTSTIRPLTSSAANSRPQLKHRSPSLSILEGTRAGPPPIPLRISSIPIDNKPRKLSLPSQTSFSQLHKSDEKENLDRDRPTTPAAPLQTMKELPSPPVDDDTQTRNAVMGDGPQNWVASAPSWDAEPSVSAREQSILSLGSPLRGERRRGRAHSHSRLHSAPASSYLVSPSPPGQQHQQWTSGNGNGDGNGNGNGTGETQWLHTPTSASASVSPTPYTQLATSPSSSLSTAAGHHRHHHPPGTPSPLPPTLPLKSTSRSSPHPTTTNAAVSQPTSKPNPKPTNTLLPAETETGSWASGTHHHQHPQHTHSQPLSKTQRDKDRKKRSKARIVVEHVDVIKDEFWVKRPWILGGGTGAG